MLDCTVQHKIKQIIDYSLRIKRYQGTYIFGPKIIFCNHQRSESEAPKAAAAAKEEDIDLFASDEEPQPKPVMVKPKKQQSKKAKAASPAPEKVWANKAECEDAEKKLQERLAQVGPSLSRVVFLFRLVARSTLFHNCIIGIITFL